MPCEVLEHTADVGLRATGPTLRAALSDLVVGFGELVCPEGEVEVRESRSLQVASANMEDLVIDVLDEINYLHQMEGFIPALCTAELGEGPSVHLAMEGERWDEERHGHLMEIKATTYHGLTVEEDPALIEVIFDI